MSSESQINQLLANTTLRQNLPSLYNGELKNEFETIVTLIELACTLKLNNHIVKSTQIFDSINNLVLLFNKFYFCMKGEKAPRFTEQNVVLAQSHAVNNIPINSSLGVFAIDQNSVDWCTTATTNICSELIKHINFTVSQFCDAFSQSKEQCKRSRKYACKIVIFVNKLLKLVNKDKDIAHQYINKSEITYANMTPNERKISQRKRRNR